MSRKPLFFCLAVSLAAHLALFFCWTGEDGRVDGRQPVAVRLIPPPASLPTEKVSLSAPARTSRPFVAAPLSPARKTSPQDISAVIPEKQPMLSVESSPPMPEAAAPGGEGASASAPVPAAPGDPPATANSESLLLATIPLYAVNPKPAYPRLAEERGWEGEVLLRVRVAAAGTVLNAEVERSSGHPILDRAALKSVANWRFQPARRGPLAVESMVLIPIPFTLRRN
jgi:protein TonB